MDNKYTKQESDTRNLNNEELKQVVGGRVLDKTFGTSDMYCSKCGHRTAHQLNRFAKWECIICGTIAE